MRWGSRRNGGNNIRTRWGQSIDAQSRNGQGHMAGHHSYAKGHGGGNKTGAISHAPKEWGSKARKEEEHLTGLARQAELDAIDEGLSDCWDDGPALFWANTPEADAWYSDVAGSPYILVNGEQVDDGPDFCRCCGQMI